MPRKKKGLKFELLPRPTKDENGKPLLYARPAIRRKWSKRWCRPCNNEASKR